MIKQLITHQWLAVVRSSIWYRKLISNIFLGLLLLLLALNFLGLGLYLDIFLKDLAPDKKLFDRLLETANVCKPQGGCRLRLCCDCCGRDGLS